MIKAGIFALLFFWYLTAKTQIITGKVFDLETKEPLPFCGIQNLSNSKATLTDLNGHFKIAANPNDKLKISYLGYETQELNAKDANIIYLKPKNIEIKGITITSKDNPAYRYIRLIQQNAHRNNPLNQEQFTYTSYNKMKSFPENKEIPDTQYQKFFQKSDLFLWETVTERKYLKPNKSNEVVKASKMSGLPGMTIPFSPTDLQDLSFYDNWVKVLGVENLSPIASTALNHYEYEIQDTLFIGQDSILTIQFYPKKNKFGFRGNLKVHTKYYHLVSIIGNMDIPEDFTFAKEVKIQQLYEAINDTFWFPTQLNTNILLNIFTSSSQSSKKDSSKSSRMILSVESFIKNINLEPGLKNKDFSNIELEVEESAAQLTEQVLEEHRIQSLTEKEINTYIKIDSLGEKAKLAQLAKQMSKLQQGFIGLKFFDIDLKRIYNYHLVEKSRLGLGIQTNEKISSNFNIGLWGGYGFGDKLWKYGAYSQWFPLKNKEFRLHLNYENSVRELGSALRFELKNFQWLYQYQPNYFSIRNFYIHHWEYYQHYSVSFYFPIVNNLNVEVKGIHEIIEPAVNRLKENFSEAAIKLRYAPLEKLTKYNGKLFIQENKGPLFWGEYRKGIPLMNSQSKHETIFLGFQQKLNFHKLGKLEVWFQAVRIINSNHMSRQVVIRTMGKTTFLSEPQTFNTLPFNIFTAEQQFLSGVKYAVNNPNFPSKKYSPDLVFLSQFYYGRINKILIPIEHLTYELNNGYGEVGLTVFNIFPEFIAKQISSLRLIGFGVFYRAYGNYDFLRNYSPWSFRIISAW